jgi:hypothetical protein
VRGEFIVRDDLPTEVPTRYFREWPIVSRMGALFRSGPYITTPDIDDVGFMSISIKLMGVPGPRLMVEEKFTDMFGVFTPTFLTPDTKANMQLQKESLKNAQIYYFLNFKRSHVLDLIMQSLGIKTQSSPFDASYFSCVPYLLGEGRAMQYSVWPKIKKRTPIPRLPFRPPDDSLRRAMVASLGEGDVEFDIRNATAGRFPSYANREQRGALAGETIAEDLRRDAAHSQAEIRLPSSDRVRETASYNPWHTIADHRPLGNQSRRPTPDVSGSFRAATFHERGATLRENRRRGLRIASR